MKQRGFKAFSIVGRDMWDRIADLLNAIQALSVRDVNSPSKPCKKSASIRETTIYGCLYENHPFISVNFAKRNSYSFLLFVFSKLSIWIVAKVA